MARIRTIKPEFWTDEKLAPLSPICRLTFLGLVSMADDAGRLNDSVKLLDGLLFSETNDSVGDSLDELESIGVIQRGSTTNGKRVIQIVGWLKHQKIEKANLKSALPEIDRRQVDDMSGKRRNLPKNVRDAILQHDDYKCCECGVDVIPEKQDRYDSRDNLAEIDHVIALADGGSDEPENMRTLCKKCNRRKQGRELAERNRRLIDDQSTTSRGTIDDMSPPGSTIYDLRSTTKDQRSTSSGAVRECPPEVEEVGAYMAIIGKDAAQAQAFVDYYTANGWVQGTESKPIKDWHSQVRIWFRKEEERNKSSPGRNAQRNQVDIPKESMFAQ